MQLDVVIPTYNRSALLGRTLQSLLAAEQPQGVDVAVYAVDNNSTDDTRHTIESMTPAFGGRLHYVHAPRQGRSPALNEGIRAGHGDVIAMIDDDETVETRWLVSIAEAFRDPTLDFAGGPYHPDAELDPPSWLPPGYPAVIGVVDGGAEERPFGPSHPGIMMGGNAVVRRRVLDEIGLYDERLGRTAHGLLSGEDDELFRRLLAAGKRGRYLPHLVIYHHVPPERLTKRYHRRWCFWHGASMGVLDRDRRHRVPYLAGVPRYMLGAVLREWLRAVRALPRGKLGPGDLFAAELKGWSLAGFVYGKFIERGEADTRRR